MDLLLIAKTILTQTEHNTIIRILASVNSDQKLQLDEVCVGITINTSAYETLVY